MELNLIRSMLEDRLIQVENGIRQCRMMLDDLEKEVVVLKMACGSSSVATAKLTC